MPVLLAKLGEAGWPHYSTSYSASMVLVGASTVAVDAEEINYLEVGGGMVPLSLSRPLQ